MKLGSQIAAGRKRAGMALGELAKQLNVKRQTVYNWERGTFLPARSRIAPLAKALGLDSKRLASLWQESSEAKQKPGRKRRSIRSFMVPLLASEGEGTVERVAVPTDLVPEDTIAFRVSDNSMAPLCRAGDIVLADMATGGEDGALVLVKMLDKPLMCRLYFRQGDIPDHDGVRAFRSPNDNITDIYASDENIEWCHRVVRLIRNFK